jgi:hypothetical protein
MKAADVIAAVRRRYGAETDNIGPEWAALDELAHNAGEYRRADLFLVRAWAGRPKGHERILVEVKVTRADLRHELARPDKIAAFGAYAHRIYFATPAGLVRDDEHLGDGVGLIEIHPTGVTREVRKAVRRPDPLPLPEHLVVEVFRRAARAEARIRTASGGDDPAAQVVALQAQLAAAQRAEWTARQASQRDTNRLLDWLRVVGDVGGMTCKCGGVLRSTRDLHSYASGHADGTPCPLRWSEPDYDALAVRLGLIEVGEALAS